jgi:formate hydrogenlyase subunit 6/NADH:ubiquinone oxidoreductase subunit I
MARTAIRNFFTKPATRRYPFVVRPVYESTRGRIINNFPKCILCSMCDKHCPANAIAVDKAAGTWKIDNFACVICGACVRVCPTKCLSMSNERSKAVDFGNLAGRTHSHDRATEPAAPKPAAPAAGGTTPSTGEASPNA